MHRHICQMRHRYDFTLHMHTPTAGAESMLRDVHMFPRYLWGNRSVRAPVLIHGIQICFVLYFRRRNVILLSTGVDASPVFLWRYALGHFSFIILTDVPWVGGEEKSRRGHCLWTVADCRATTKDPNLTTTIFFGLFYITGLWFRDIKCLTLKGRYCLRVV